MRGNSDILRLVLKKKYRFAIIFYRSFKTNLKNKYDINFRICFILKTVKPFKVPVVLFI